PYLGDSSNGGTKGHERLKVCIAQVLGDRLADAWHDRHALQALSSSVEFTVYQCRVQSECGTSAAVRISCIVVGVADWPDCSIDTAVRCSWYGSCFRVVSWPLSLPNTDTHILSKNSLNCFFLLLCTPSSTCDGTLVRPMKELPHPRKCPLGGITRWRELDAGPDGFLNLKRRVCFFDCLRAIEKPVSRSKFQCQVCVEDVDVDTGKG
ncbi:hypothetical protein EDD17DRAFT_1621159, partial [Pisolithus thermaeus]